MQTFLLTVRFLKAKGTNFITTNSKGEGEGGLSEPYKDPACPNSYLFGIPPVPRMLQQARESGTRPASNK